MLSGKGGTGKTSLTGCLAHLNQQSVVVDCDVDASNLHLILKPEVKKQGEFVAGRKARIDSESCNACGKCEEYCRFEAIEQRDGVFSVDEIRCEGCGVCLHVCPEDAVAMRDNVAGRWFESTTPYGPFAHGELGIGQGNSGKLVSLLKQQARYLARDSGLPLIIIDGPPGIGCPVIASLSGADYALIVTEPSPSARDDMIRILELAGHFHIPTGLCVNKFDLNEEVTASIETEAKRCGADLIGRISFDRSFTHAQRRAATLIEYGSERTVEQIRAIWNKLKPRVMAAETAPPQDQCEGCPFVSVRPPDIGGRRA